MIRTLRAEDGPTWQTLYASVAAEGRWIGAESPVTNREAEIVGRYLDSDRAVLFPAEVDGAPVGWTTADVDACGRADLGMAVVAGYRGLGVGSRLMDAVLAWARSHADRLTLDVFPHNAAAIALYRRLGFVHVETRQGAWARRNGERWDLLRMERPVEPGAP